MFFRRNVFSTHFVWERALRRSNWDEKMDTLSLNARHIFNILHHNQESFLNCNPGHQAFVAFTIQKLSLGLHSEDYGNKSHYHQCMSAYWLLNFEEFAVTWTVVDNEIDEENSFFLTIYLASLMQPELRSTLSGSKLLPKWDSLRFSAWSVFMILEVCSGGIVQIGGLVFTCDPASPNAALVSGTFCPL